MNTEPLPPGDGAVKAHEIEQRARALVEGHAHFRGRARRFDFQYREEVLTVRGNVPSFYLKQVLQSVLINLEGVRLVENRVNVLSAEFRSDSNGG
jgi:hypothetical protein